MKGEMSVVGPRPERPELEEKIVSKITLLEMSIFIETWDNWMGSN